MQKFKMSAPQAADTVPLPHMHHNHHARSASDYDKSVTVPSGENFCQSSKRIHKYQKSTRHNETIGTSQSQKSHLNENSQLKNQATMKTTNKIQICMAIFSLLFLCGASVSHADTFSVSINNNNLSPDGARIVCFIVTHSQQVPVVAVANNDGFPKESTVAASQNSYQGQDGINVSIVLVLGLA